MPDRSDLIQTLARFTPDASKLDRDALLFAAGRASVPRRRWLFAVVGLLTLSQAATLVWLWPHETSPTRPTVVPSAMPTIVPANEPELSSPSPYSLAHATKVLNQTGELVKLEPRYENLKPDSAPLSVRSQNLSE